MAALETQAPAPAQTRLPLSLFTGPDAPAVEELYKCIHCGFCLQACPTYVETGLETESPRGRIALMKAVIEGRIGLTPKVFRHWDLCIQCRACEAVCPSGVPYGHLIEATMAQVETHRRLPLAQRLLARLILNGILPHQNRLTFVVGALRLYQQSGLRALIRRSGLLRLGKGTLAELERSLPPLPSSFFAGNGQVVHSMGTPRARVALLSGCIMPLIHGPEMRTVGRVLARNGCQVLVPAGQVCCGAIHTHVGDLATARGLARRNIDVFLTSKADAVVVASAGCGIRMKEYGHLLRNDPAYAEKAHRLSSMVKDVHEFLAELPFTPPQGRLEYKVTYQDPCHLTHTQGITSQPRTLLRSIPGLQFVEMANSSRCCGAGGTYTITQREFSLRLLDRKMASVLETGANVVATGNPGCLLQLQYGAVRAGTPVQVKYVIDLLDEAYSREPRRPPPIEVGPTESAWEQERLELRARWRFRSGDWRRRPKS